MPVAAYATIDGDLLSMSAMASSPDGANMIRADGTYDVTDPDTAGEDLAKQLLDRGAFQGGRRTVNGSISHRIAWGHETSFVSEQILLASQKVLLRAVSPSTHGG